VVDVKQSVALVVQKQLRGPVTQRQAVADEEHLFTVAELRIGTKKNVAGLEDRASPSTGHRSATPLGLFKLLQSLVCLIINFFPVFLQFVHLVTFSGQTE